jgi:predicted MFS family arabinose efflux permease
MNINKKIIKFGLFDAIFWCYCASYCGFITSYFLDRGMNRTVLSIDSSVYMIVAFVAAVFWGNRCDRIHSNKKVFIPEYILTIIISIGVFMSAGINISLTPFVYPILAFTVFPLGSNMDAWMLSYLDHDTASYSKSRAMGSVGFAVSMLICGQLINSFGYSMMLVISISLGLITLIIAFLMGEPQDDGISVKAKKPSFTKLFGYKKYISMLAVTFLIGLAISPINNFKIVILEEIGGNVSSLGIDAFIGVSCQALFIFLSGSMRRIPAQLRLAIMSLCMTVSIALTFWAGSPLLVFMGTAVSNTSFGIMLPTVREITQKEVSSSLVNTAYSLSDAVYGSVSAVVALSYSGFMMDQLGTRSICILGLVITAAVTVYTFAQNVKKDHRTASEVSLLCDQKCS